MENPPKKGPQPVSIPFSKRVPRPLTPRQRTELATEVGRLACQVRERTALIRESLKAARQL